MSQQVKTQQVVDSQVKVNLQPTQITQVQLVNILFNVQGVTFIGVETTTVPGMNLGGTSHDNYMYDNVVKHSTIHCMLGFDYEARRDTLAAQNWVSESIQAALEAGVDIETVNNAVGHLKEYSAQSIEKFEAQKRGWGKHMFNPSNGKLSRIMIDHTKTDKNGNELPETYAQYMQVEVLGAKTPIYCYKDTGLVLSDTDMATVKKYLKKSTPDNLVIRDYKIEGIKQIRINKKSYVVIG